MKPEDFVYQQICNLNYYKTELRTLKLWEAQCHDPDRERRLKMLRERIESIDSWFGLLSTKEAFVIQKHLIEKFDWPQVIIEFRNRWGSESERTDRTLQRYQKRALREIAKFAGQKAEYYETVFTAECVLDACEVLEE